MSLIIRLFEGSRTNYNVIEKWLLQSNVGHRMKESVGTYHFAAISRHVGGDPRKQPDKISPTD